MRNEKACWLGVVRGPSADGAPAAIRTVQAVSFGSGAVGFRAIQRSGGVVAAMRATLGSPSTSSCVATRSATVRAPATSARWGSSADRSMA